MHRLYLAAAAAAVAIAAPPVAGAQGRTVMVMASDFKFDAPDSIPSGITTFQLMNHGPELHHMQIVRLEQGKTFADFEAAAKNPGPPPAWITFVGGPNAGIPDGQHTTTVTATLPAGNYVMLCLIPGPDGKPHLAKGMYRALKVTGSSRAVAQTGAPKADAVMTLFDYNFELDKPLTAGKRTILIKNTAKQAHEAFVVKLPPNVPPTALLEWMAGGMKGHAAGNSRWWNRRADVRSGEPADIDLEPGDYALYCFVPAPDGKEHVAHGMFKQITVAK